MLHHVTWEMQGRGSVDVTGGVLAYLLKCGECCLLVLHVRVTFEVKQHSRVVVV